MYSLFERKVLIGCTSRGLISVFLFIYIFVYVNSCGKWITRKMVFCSLVFLIKLLNTYCSLEAIWMLSKCQHQFMLWKSRLKKKKINNISTLTSVCMPNILCVCNNRHIYSNLYYRLKYFNLSKIYILGPKWYSTRIRWITIKNLSSPSPSPTGPSPLPLHT